MILSEACRVLEVTKESSRAQEEELDSNINQASSSPKHPRQHQQQPLVQQADALLLSGNREPATVVKEESSAEKKLREKKTPRPNKNGSNKWDEFRDRWRKAKQRNYARERRDNLKHKYDYRDRKAGNNKEEEELLCMFCGVNKGISQVDAHTDGLQWEEYASHPAHYRTCWTCKNSHISVLTESMAQQKFSKKLQDVPKTVKTTTEDGGEARHRAVFLQLRDARKTFHHQPRTGRFKEETRKSEYFWYPDLEQEALKLGWLPRGKKKELVPWTRKDVPVAMEEAVTTSARCCTEEEEHHPPPTPKKAKTSVAGVTP